MILLRRSLLFLVGAGLLVQVMVRFGMPAAALFDPRALLLTLLAPWVVLAMSDSPSSAFQALANGLLGLGGDQPPTQRAAQASRLATVAGLSLGLGVLAGFLALVTGFNALASAGGQAKPGALAQVASGLLLGPIYGLMFKGLLYEPAVAALEAEAAELGASLMAD